MSTDLLAPVLYEPHYDALNRRLDIAIQEVEKCIANAESEGDVLKEEPKIEDYVETEHLLNSHSSN